MPVLRSTRPGWTHSLASRYSYFPVSWQHWTCSSQCSRADSEGGWPCRKRLSPSFCLCRESLPEYLVTSSEQQVVLGAQTGCLGFLASARAQVRLHSLSKTIFPLPTSVKGQPGETFSEQSMLVASLLEIQQLQGTDCIQEQSCFHLHRLMSNAVLQKAKIITPPILLKVTVGVALHAICQQNFCHGF